jgi:hypothetical protein
MLVAVVAAEATAEGHVYWETIDVDPGTGLVYLQLALAVVIVTALALAAEIAQRERAAAAWASAQAAGQEAARSAAERTALLEAERTARERAEVLERNASHLAAAAGATDVALDRRRAGGPGSPSWRSSSNEGRSDARVGGDRRDTLDRIEERGHRRISPSRSHADRGDDRLLLGRRVRRPVPGVRDERRQNVLESLVAIPIRDAAERSSASCSPRPPSAAGSTTVAGRSSPASRSSAAWRSSGRSSGRG